MRRILKARYLASALAIGIAPYVATAVPASAQMYGDVSFDSFHDELAQYGYWVYSDRWGLVWQPAGVPNDFRPYYTAGRWVYTDDYGWYWASDLPWGDIAFHYGRWVDDPYDGWLWIPGYTWSPGWVLWRSNGQYIGWMPTPPDDAFLEGRGDVSFGLSFNIGGVAFNWNNDPYYGYRRWYGPDFDQGRFAANWVFVGWGNLADRDYRRVVVRDPRLVVNLVQHTRNVTHYTVVNNYVVNKSVDVRLVQRAAGHPIQITPARSIIRNPNLVMRVDASRRIQERERLIAPRGTGLANSAPPPSASVVGRLSTQGPPQRNGGPSQHLFTRSTIANPDVQSRFRGRPAGGFPSGMNGEPAGPNGPGMTGPRMGSPGDQLGRRDQGQPNGQPGGPNGPGELGDMAGPRPGGQSDQFRQRDQGPPTGQPGSESGPNGPGGMNGPGGPGQGAGPGNGGNQGQTPWGRHRPVPKPTGSQPGSIEGPNPGNSMGGPNPDRSTGGPNGGKAGPGGADNQAQPAVVHHRDQAPSGGQPGGMMGPGSGGGMDSPGGNGAGPGGPPEHRTRPETQPGSMPPPALATGQGQPPKPDKKKPHPDTPPGQPQ